MFATGASVVSGFATLRLLSRHVSKEDYAVVGVAVNMMNYLPLLDGGFRMVINRRLLSGKGLDEGDTATRRTELIHFSQSLQSWVGLLALGMGTALMMLYSQTPNARDAHQPWTFYLALAAAGAVGMLQHVHDVRAADTGRIVGPGVLEAALLEVDDALVGVLLGFHGDTQPQVRQRPIP